jgi:DNA-binding NtrC family response regulator
MNEDFRIRFLIVDDDASIRELCLRIGESLGFVCLEAESAETALTLLETASADVVVTALFLPRKSGVELLERIKSAWPRSEVAIMTGHGSIGNAVAAMKLGAYHYVTKPFAVEEMKLTLERMAEKVCLMAERDRLRDRVRELQTCMARVGDRSSDDSVDAAGVPTILRQPHAPAASEPLAPQAPTDLEHLERITIQRVFEQVHGDKMLAHKMLGISRATLYRKLKRYKIGSGARAAAGGNS